MPRSRDADATAHVLAVLDTKSPDFCSGVELGAALGVSRTAVWKRIEALRAAGYDIEARPRAGYRLNGGPDVLTPQRVQAGLHVQRIGRTLSHHLEVDSTMTVAAAQAEAGAPDGTVVVAERQTHGRGRLGRSWHTAPGRGIWMTVILRPPLSPMELLPLSLLAGVAVAEGVEAATGLDARIKWPNDVHIGGRKVSGILIELAAEQDAVRYVLVGIGINVYQAPAEFPDELRASATSLAQVSGHSVDRVHVFREVLMALDREYEQALQNGFGAALDRCRARSATLGRRVAVVGSGRTVRGIARDLTDQGGLVVHTEAGREEIVLSGDVTLEKDAR